MCCSSDDEAKPVSDWKTRDEERRRQIEQKLKEFEERYITDTHLDNVIHVFKNADVTVFAVAVTADSCLFLSVHLLS